MPIPGFSRTTTQIQGLSSVWKFLPPILGFSRIFEMLFAFSHIASCRTNLWIFWLHFLGVDFRISCYHLWPPFHFVHLFCIEFTHSVKQPLTSQRFLTVKVSKIQVFSNVPSFCCVFTVSREKNNSKNAHKTAFFKVI